jgi:acetolactate synthase I/II/III large subunit
MNGAECLLRTLLDCGVDTCFINPGTSEMQFISALDRVEGMRSVLCLFEGVCSGAADGYARMSRHPAATLLHLGPGLGNALSNLHNARKARMPVVNIVGQHTTQHLRYDAPLTADIEAFARPVSGWVRTLQRSHDMGADTVSAVRAAYGPPGQVATFIVPADFSWSEAGEPGPASQAPGWRSPQAECVRGAASILKSGGPVGLLLGGGTLLAPGLEAAGRLAAGTGVRVFADRNAARMERGAGRFSPLRLPYFPEAAESALAGLKHLILVESLTPVSFFGYRGRRSTLAPEDCSIHVLAAIDENGTEALQELVQKCGAGSVSPSAQTASRPGLLNGLLDGPPHGAPLTPETIGLVLSAEMPEGSIVSDEMISSTEAILQNLAAARPYDLLPVTGGSIGQGLPVAVGAAVACPDRKVVALEGDGSAMYTLQSLWTMARERLDVVVVILANRHYRILEMEYRRAGAGEIGPRANDMMDLMRPELDWVKLAEGQGVPACRAATGDEFIARFREAANEPGPRLIEAVLG